MSSAHGPKTLFWMMVSLLFGLASCRDSGVPKAWIHPNISSHVSFIPKTTAPTAFDIWRGNNLTLRAHSLDDLIRLDQKIKYPLVMVSFAVDSQLSASLVDDPLTLAFLPATTTRDGAALVLVPDDLILDGLAAAAHQGPGLACGRVESLSLEPLALQTSLTPPVYQEHVRLSEVEALIAQPEESRIRTSIEVLEALGTRHAKTVTGVQTTAKVKELFQNAIASGFAKASYSEIAHQDVYNSEQKSLILALPGVKDDATTVIIGAHLDSINAQGQSLGAPGADDNASGIATMVEVARILSKAGAGFARRVEFHAYAIEEQGLYGSSDIARRYRSEGRQVAAMIQLDMNAYAQTAGDTTIYLVENDTSATLRRSVKDLLNTYLGGNYVEKRLSGGTSDHKSWTNNGYAAVFPFEDPEHYNQALHSDADTLKAINSLGLSRRFAQLVLAFLSHHAGLVSAEESYEKSRATSAQSLSNDLKLAVLNSEAAEGSHQLAVASDAATKKLTVCLAATTGDARCAQEPVSLERSAEKNGRVFFVTAQAQPLDDKTRLLLRGYDTDDVLSVERSVIVTRKKHP